jgi:hypothetical protein
MKRRAFVSLLIALGCLGTPALADELGDRVRNLYRPYEKAGADVPDVNRVLKTIASKRLRDLIARDEVCAKRTESVCNLGHDPIINGQDYKVDRVDVGSADIDGEKAKVLARFRNFEKPFESRYEFVREGGAWKLDDIVALQPKDYRWRLTTILAPKGRKAR